MKNFTRARFKHYALGHSELDESLFDIMSKCDELRMLRDKATAIKSIVTLSEKWSIHVYKEQKVMEDLKYPYSDIHNREHLYIARILHDTLVKLSKLPKDYSFNTKTSPIVKLSDTVLTHLDNHDRQLGLFLAAPVR